METPLGSQVRFLTVTNSKQEERQARFLISSLRSFGGELKDCLVWVFQPGKNTPEAFSDLENVTTLPLEMEEPYRSFELADKVFACARAEELCGSEVGSLVWLNLDCLIVNPPLLFDLGQDFDAALRPVHIRNVGSLAGAPPDCYWETVYQTIGVTNDIPYTVESCVDAQTIRPYFNTHCFSVNPAKEIMQAWRETFKQLVDNKEFVDGPCLGASHQVFLHQVVVSALIMKLVEHDRIRMLPPTYSYPLHLQEKLPPAKRITSLNQMVCAVFEEMDRLDQVTVEEPLKSWLVTQRA
jgi:hypothetical protein